MYDRLLVISENIWFLWSTYGSENIFFYFQLLVISENIFVLSTSGNIWEYFIFKIDFWLYLKMFHSLVMSEIKYVDGDSALQDQQSTQ